MSISALEFFIEKVLFACEVHHDEDGEWIDEPRTVYYNAYKGGVDLSEFVKQARQIEDLEQHATCSKCGNPSRGSGTCPYDEEFNNGYSDSCDCCDHCRRECLYDI